MKQLLVFALILTTFVGVFPAQTATLPKGYWGIEKSQTVIDKTQTIRLAPDVSGLSAGEKAAMRKLFEAGAIFQELYELQRDSQSVAARRNLEQLDKKNSSAATRNLLSIYRINQGVIGTTIDGKREPFLPIQPQASGGMYPADSTKAEIDQFLAANPDKQSSILGSRTIVRRATAANLKMDLATLKQFPVLDVLHFGLRKELETTKANDKAFYAVPYSVGYADRIVRAHALLNEAADAVQKDDEEFAGYLRNRSRDLLSDDYESGDAAWVTAQFKNLNGQMGSYETYDDPFYGVKTYFSFNVLKTRQPETTTLRKALSNLQKLEDSLPYTNHKKVKEDISVGVYDIVADFGQSRGANTATILPNEALYARRYGRTILIRSNILQNPEIFEANKTAWQTAVAPEHKNELTPEGQFYYTLWHEVGHYLGVDRTNNGQDLDAALQENSNTMEEMKADLVSLYSAEALQKQGYYTEQQLRAVYASGIRRVLQTAKPNRSQPYQTMQVMQWNFFMENDLVAFDNQTKELKINYKKYHEVIGKLLAKVLDVQYQGDKAAADKFIEQYSNWDENLHGAIAKKIRDQQKYRFRLFKYAALGE